jgi:hypothetical protein
MMLSPRLVGGGVSRGGTGSGVGSCEGVAAETFVDSSDREHFDNWDEYQALVAGAAPVAEMDMPRAKSARQVPAAVRALIEARAEALLGKAAAAA